MELSHINWLAVIAAALSNFFLGGLWYSPFMFGKAWQAENGFSDEQLKKVNTARVFGVSFIWSLVMSFSLAYVLAGQASSAILG
jgi:hypothetical protein